MLEAGSTMTSQAIQVRSGEECDGDVLDTASLMTSQAIQVRSGEECDGDVLDMASLMLRRMNAVPIRLKILLDRLFTGLDHERVLAILHDCGWLYEDYLRGYKHQVGHTDTPQLH